MHHDVAGEIEAAGIVAIVRLDDLDKAVPLTEALVAGGVRAIEFTFTNRLAGRAIEDVRATVGDRVLVGAGTVLDAETARIALLHGAQFIVTPVLDEPTIQTCSRYAVPSAIGAFTPTEIFRAWQAGATFVKVFPASVGGPKYLKDVRGPLPQVKLIPTGGVSVETAGAFIKAGAVAVAAGSNLVDAKTVDAEQWDVLTERAKALVGAVRAARG